MTAIIDGTNGVTTPNVLTSSSGVALTLQSGGTTAVTIDTSQRVGIGTTSPAAKLDIVGSSDILGLTNTSGSSYESINMTVGTQTARILLTGQSFADANYGTGDLTIQAQTAGKGIRFGTGGNVNQMFIDSSGNVGIGTSSPTQKLQVAGNAFISAGQYFMWDNAGAWSLQSDASTYVRTLINGNEQLRVNAYGIGIGGTTPSSGTGVTFPATQNASSNANTLDDYEEGTFTPTVSPNGGGSLTSYNSGGSYIKIGRNVFINGFFTITNAGTAAGTALIAGLPFNTQNTNGTPNRTSICIVREDSQTGLFYAGYTNYNSAFLTLTSLTNGAIVWTNNYTYIFTTSYISAS